MASDIAEILKENFLEFVQEKDLNLSPRITSLLNEIEKEFTENKAYWSPPPPKSLSYLYQLDHTLSECRANNKTLSFFSRFDPLERSNENVLKNIKDQLKDMGKEKVNPNSTSPLYTSCMYPTRNDTPELPVFDKEIEKIVNLLESNDGFKAIGIHGMCGTGKTTLAKMVLEDERIRDKYKEPIWVCLYDLKSVDEMDIKIVKEMLAELNEDPDLLTEEPDDDWLVRKLHAKLKDEKYLVVLDGVWHSNDWFSDLSYVGDDDKSKKLLFSQALPKNTGGAVIVTSRKKEVTTKLVHEEKNLIHLKPWNDEKWKDAKLKELVKQCLERESKSNETISKEKIIDFVTYHCHGLPLVAVTLSAWLAKQIN